MFYLDVIVISSSHRCTYSPVWQKHVCCLMWSQGDSNFNEHNILCEVSHGVSLMQTHLPSNVISFELKVQQSPETLSADCVNTACPFQLSIKPLRYFNRCLSWSCRFFECSTLEDRGTEPSLLLRNALEHKQCCGHTYFFWMASCLSHRQTETERLYSNQSEQKPTSFIHYIKQTSATYWYCKCVVIMDIFLRLWKRWRERTSTHTHTQTQFLTSPLKTCKDGNDALD